VRRSVGGPKGWISWNRWPRKGGGGEGVGEGDTHGEGEAGGAGGGVGSRWITEFFFGGDAVVGGGA